MMLVRWVDAWHDSEIYNKEELSTLGPCILESIGFGEYTKEGIVLVGEVIISKGDGQELDGAFKNVQFIPTEFIREVCYLRKGKREVHNLGSVESIMVGRMERDA